MTTKTTESIAEQFHFDLEDFTTLDAGRAKLVLERDWGGADVPADITAPEPVEVFSGESENYSLTLFADGSLIVDTNADTEIWLDATDWIGHALEPRGPRGGVAFENMDRAEFEILRHFDRLDEDDFAYLESLKGTNEGEVIYQFVEGWEPTVPYTTDEDGNWIED